jgi:hypothetical protein
MAQIDPRLQERLTGVVLGAAAAFKRLGEELMEGALAAQDLAIELDADAKEKAAAIAADAIDKARK